MLDLAVFHPQITEFAVALLMAGVVARCISLTGKLTFTRPGAATLLLLGTLAAILAVRSGLQAHEAVERVPGIGPAVNAHEDAGEWARNVFLVVSGIELVGLALVNRPRWRRRVEVASAIVGLVGAAALYRAADRGGDLVFNYAGGVGIRSGDTTDVSRLLTAGLFEQAMVARKAHRPGEADTLLSELARLHPSDPNVQLVHAQSLLEDRKDPAAALAVLNGIVVPDSLAFLKSRVAFQKADAFLAATMQDSARATLTALLREFAGNPRMSARIKDRLARIPAP
jgi:uncharacterized membrane protein